MLKPPLKHLFRFCVAALFTAAAALDAQQLPPGRDAANAPPVSLAGLPQEAFTIALDKPAPLSPAVKTGKLSNGLRYFIRKNAEPKNRAELRLVVDVGSVLEDDNQVGLAHVLEHMAFNGTEHFKKQQIVEFIKSIGMKFGADLNASTSFDETIYQLQLPTEQTSYLDSGFQILADWASAVTLDPEEIQLERGVVIEEWRQGRGAQGRVRDQQLPVILKDSQYAQRLPIGTLQNLQNFDPALLRRFYKDWYRPELMAVIAVGDFEPADIERLLHQHFDAIPASKNPKERKRFGVPAQTDTQFAITADPEIPTTQITVYHKEPALFDWTIGGSRQRMVEALFNAMLSTRFTDLARQANPPFLGAASGQASLVRPIKANALLAVVPETGIKRGLESLLTEAARAARFGFTAEELERQKTILLRNIDQSYTNRDTRTSASHVAEMVRSFLTGESIPGTEFETALYKRFVPGITLDEVNLIGKNWMSATNTVVAVTAPSKPGLVTPTAADLSAVIADVAKAELKPLEQAKNDEPLLTIIPKASKVTATRALNGGLTEWTLQNGIKVILLPTDFKKDEILFVGFSEGGTSLVSDADFVPASTASMAIGGGGLGKFNDTDLRHKLAGKVANVTGFISETEQGVSGSGSTVDLETLFQLIYLRMTDPRADATFFTNLMAQLKVSLQNKSVNPQSVFDDTFTRLRYQNHPRYQPLAVETLDKFDLAKSLAVYKDRLGDATGFTFIFVGSIDPKAMQPLVETYIGGLPTSGRKETWKDVGVRAPLGVVEETVKRGLEQKSSTRIAYTGPFNSQSLNERTVVRATTELVQARLLTVLREQLSGTYGVNVSYDITRKPIDSIGVQVNFSTDPVRTDEMTTAYFAEIEKLKTAGPTAMEVADERQALLRSFENSSKTNGGWLSVLNYSYRQGVNPGADDFLNFPKSVEAVTVDSVRNAVKQYFNRDNHIRVTLLPEKMPESAVSAAPVKN